jgi:hypothetical protein
MSSINFLSLSLQYHYSTLALICQYLFLFHTEQEPNTGGDTLRGTLFSLFSGVAAPATQEKRRFFASLLKTQYNQV